MREDHHYVNMNLKDTRKILNYLLIFFELLIRGFILFNESWEKKSNRNERFEGY